MPQPIKALLLTGLHQRRCDLRGCERRAYAAIHATGNAYCQSHLQIMARGVLALEQEQERREQQRPDFILPEDMQ